MDKYIILSIDKDYLIFSQTNSVPSPKEFINTSKNYHNKYIYTYRFFKKNDKDIINAIYKVIITSKVTKAYIEDSKLTTITLEFIKLLKIDIIYIKTFKALTISECNLIINNKSITYVNAYFIPSEYLKKMLRLRKRININYADALTDEFMISQDVIDGDAVYYKKTLHLRNNYQYKEKDIIEFLKLNIYLKSIHLYVYNKEIIESIIKQLNKDGRHNVVLFLYQNDDFIEKNFKYLKEINSDYKKELNGDIRLIYSKNYVQNNLFKQLTYNNIKLSLIIILYVLIVGIVFVGFYEYASKLNIDKLNYELYMSNLNSSSDQVSSEINENTSSEEEYQEPAFMKNFDSLKKINSEVVGWITVNNTKVNYPVVQHSDNEYYLKNDIYKSKSSYGWIFMDFRNNANELNLNTIIYGHKLKNGLMFGTLSDTLNSSWYKKKENQIISFDTENAEMKWQIFSIYTTEYTTDYLATNFLSEEQFNEFANNITSKSIYNFKQSIDYSDKILTLSTCIGRSADNKRLVIHAKLIE